MSEIVVNALSESPVGTLGHKALLSFDASVRDHGIEMPSEDGLRLWIADMILAGLRQTTRRRYFNNIHALCKSKYDFALSDPFENVRSDINREFEVNTKQPEDNLKVAGKLLAKSSDALNGNGRSELRDIFLCLLYDVEAPLNDIVNFSFADADGRLPQIEDIADRYRRSNRSRYVFGLNQRQARDSRIIRNLTTALSRMLEAEGMRFGGCFSRESITEIWIAAALRCGVTTREIRSIVNALPKNYSFLEMVGPADISASRKHEIIRRVADSINDNKKYWYAMQLRPGKSPDDVRNRLKTKSYPLADEIKFYYPVHAVIRKCSGKKIRKEEVPYLPGILFFYLRRNDVKTLFGRYIGDEAWCYRYANHPDSPYSAISRKEMERFQRHIGEFTDDIRMEMVTREMPLSEDDLVTVYGGVMDGRICRIREIDNSNGHRTYSLELTERTAVRWTVTDVEEIRLEPLGEARRQALVM